VKAFLDTNVLVAAFATRGLCEDVLRVVLAEHELVLGTHVLVEFERVLVKKLGMPPRKAAATRSFLANEARLVRPRSPASWPRNDPDDQWIAAAALEANADVLVTGDEDLLSSQKSSPIPIVSPRDFWARLR
jgi:putative PIN family toxin of toxin-antitoxin system